MLAACVGHVPDNPGADGGDPGAGSRERAELPASADGPIGPCREAADWLWPVPTHHAVGQSFGNPISYQSCGFHTGIDVFASTGDPILAAADGLVVWVGPLWLDAPGTGRGPYAVVVQHGAGLYSTYSHGNAAHVKAGDCVREGDRIADVGSLGYSGGPHLHFELLSDTSFTGDWSVPFEDACAHYVDPLDYVEP